LIYIDLYAIGQAVTALFFMAKTIAKPGADDQRMTVGPAHHFV
jgi:hypothetical protein